MKTIIKILTLVVLSGLSFSGKSQVLISLLLGEKLNTGKIEFGLDGGVNFPTLSGLPASKPLTSFHLGFYFDIKLKDPWMLHTGVLVKTTLGVAGLPVYSTGNAEIDSSFAGGSINRHLGYFNVPVMIKWVSKKHFYAEAGFQLGLMNNAFDEFTNDINNKNDLVYKLKIKDQFHPLDAGLAAGIGYRLFKGNGMNLAIRYYYGLVDVMIDDNRENVFNRSLYLAVGIPIGAGKKKETE